MGEHIFVFENDFQIARKKIRENSENQIVFSSDNDELNRKILEKEKIDFLLINLGFRKDKQKQRDSGFNQVMAKIAKKNKIGVGINLDEIVFCSLKERAEIMARVRQNIKICNKSKLNMKFFSLRGLKRDKYELTGLGLVLGMPTWMTKDF